VSKTVFSKASIEKKLMSEAALEKPTLESLAAEVRRFRERLEDIEDLIELRAAVERNAGKPGIPWEKVRAELFGNHHCANRPPTGVAR
jgi:hypothetical protein